MKDKDKKGKQGEEETEQEGVTDDNTQMPKGPMITISQPELVIIVKPEYGLRAMSDGDGFACSTGKDVTSLNRLLTAKGITVKPLFEEAEQRLMDEARSFTPMAGAAVPDLSIYYHVTPDPSMTLSELAESLLGE